MGKQFHNKNLRSILKKEYEIQSQIGFSLQPRTDFYCSGDEVAKIDGMQISQGVEIGERHVGRKFFF